MKKANVEEFLKSKNIEYKLHEHVAVYTCEDTKKYCNRINGLVYKSLFLTNKKRNRYLLVILSDEKRLNLKKFAEIVGEKKLSFASPEVLLDKLCLTPGSVSPFGLLNDNEKEVEFYIDKGVLGADIVSFHPNRNTASLELTQEMFAKFLQEIGHNVKIVDL